MFGWVDLGGMGRDGKMSGVFGWGSYQNLMRMGGKGWENNEGFGWVPKLHQIGGIWGVGCIENDGWNHP